MIIYKNKIERLAEELSSAKEEFVASDIMLKSTEKSLENATLIITEKNRQLSETYHSLISEKKKSESCKQELSIANKNISRLKDTLKVAQSHLLYERY